VAAHVAQAAGHAVPVVAEAVAAHVAQAAGHAVLRSRPVVLLPPAQNVLVGSGTPLRERVAQWWGIVIGGVADEFTGLRASRLIDR
jgi:hypothetical protein